MKIKKLKNPKYKRKNMKKIGFLILLLTGILLLPSSLAEEVKVIPNTTMLKIYAGSSDVVEVTIVNDQDFADTFSISVDPEIYEGITATLDKSFITIEAHSNQSLKLYFFVPKCSNEGSIEFKVSARSTQGAYGSASIILNVRRKYTICISDFTLSKYGELMPGETISISAYLTNPTDKISSSFFIQVNVKKEDQMVKTFYEEIDGIAQKSTKVVTYNFTFDKYASPGEYGIELLLKDKLNNIRDSMLHTVKIKEVNKTVFTKSTKIGLLSAITTIRVKNEGNVPVPITITASIPSFAGNLFFAHLEPTEERRRDGWIEYQWLFEEVKPGDEVSVTYEIKLLYVWIFCLVVAIIVILAFRFVYGPAVVKRYRLRGPISPKGEITIALEVKNKSRHEIKNVEVRDVIPPIFSLVEKFDTIRPSKIGKTKAGTVLLWKIDSMKPFEERVLTYKIKPKVEVTGTLRLPEARIKFTDRKKIVRSVVSKSILIRPS